VAEEVDALVTRCLQHRPEDRFQTFAEIGAALEQYSRRADLDGIPSGGPSITELEASMTYHDWSGPAYALGTLGRLSTEETQRRYFERSHEYYVRALELNPNAPGAHSNVAISLGRLGKVTEAIPHAERELQLHSEHAWVYPPLADFYLAVGRGGEALELYERAAALAPHDTALWRRLAEAAASMKREDVRSRAVGRFIEALRELSDEQAAVVAISSACVAAQQGDVATAFDLHRYSVDTWPNAALAWFNFGVSLHRGGIAPHARLCYDKALRLDPTLSGANLLRGLLRAASGAVSEARDDWHVAAAGRDSTIGELASRFLGIANGEVSGLEIASIAKDPRSAEMVARHRYQLP
jgi:tetratricopeptide (TPR) repeat protein